MSIQMSNPNFNNIDLSHYTPGNIQQQQQQFNNGGNGMMMNQQQMQQHVVPHLHHLQQQQGFNNSTSTNSNMSPSCNNNNNSNNLTSNKSSTNTPQITQLQASPANLTNSPSAIVSSPITISNNSSLNSPSTTSSPNLLLNGTSNKRIMISQQTCLVEEKFSKNGVQKNVHVVVKNNPFLLTLSLLDNSLNFHQLTPEVQLVYDSESLKEVDSATVKPLEYKTRANEEGDQLTIELRIKVLSSQLEDMLFRAKVKIVDPRTRKETHGLSVITHPIRVVSKPDQVKKKAKKRKRAPTDSLMDTLNRIEHQQKEQQRLLKKLCYHDKENNIIQLIQQQQQAQQQLLLQNTTTCNNNNNNNNNIDNNNNNNTDNIEPIVKIENTDCNNNSTENEENNNKPIVNGKDEFQNAFKEFIGAFKQLQCLDPDGADGAFKINTCANDAQTMCEILEMVKVELKKDENFKDKCGGGGASNGAHHNNAGNAGGACGENDPDNPCSCKVCPYKQKVDHINQSYENYFSMFNANSVVPQQQAQQQTHNPQQQIQQQQQVEYTTYIDPQIQLQQQQQLQLQQQQFMQQQSMDQQQYYMQQYHLQQQQQQAQQRYLMQQQQQYIQQQQAAAQQAAQQQQQQQAAAQQQVSQSQTQSPQNPQQSLDFQQNNFIDFNSGLGFMNFPNINFGDIGFSAV